MTKAARTSQSNGSITRPLAAHIIGGTVCCCVLVIALGRTLVQFELRNAIRSELREIPAFATYYLQIDKYVWVIAAMIGLWGLWLLKTTSVDVNGVVLYVVWTVNALVLWAGITFAVLYFMNVSYV